jgi:hypothetical protein
MVLNATELRLSVASILGAPHGKIARAPCLLAMAGP